MYGMRQPVKLTSMRRHGIAASRPTMPSTCGQRPAYRGNVADTEPRLDLFDAAPRQRRHTPPAHFDRTEPIKIRLLKVAAGSM